MKPSVRLLQVGFLAFLLSVLLSCGSGWNSAPNNNAEPKVYSVVSVALTDNYLTVSGGETHQFAATVKGSSNTSVTWGLTDCTGETCGSISSTGLYTAPSVVPARVRLTITATAQADPKRVDYATIDLMPIEVSISPAGAWVAAGEAHVFTASVLYDSQAAGVTWILGPDCSGNCGTLSNVVPTSVTYTAPATAPDSSPMKLMASSVSNPNKKAEITITLAAEGGIAEGDYVFVWNGWETPITNGYYWMYEAVAVGRFHTDAQGNITEGVEDINSQSGVTQALPFTGSYRVGADGRGTFTFVSAQGSATYRMALDVSRKRGKIIRSDPLDPDSPIFGSGYFEMQDKAAFSLAALAGPYAFGVFGTLEANRLATVGRFDADPLGAFTGGSADMSKQVYGGSDIQVNSTKIQLAGSLGAPSASTGRGTATLNWGSPYTFAYYIVSDQKVLLVQIDTRGKSTPILSGEARRQKGPFSTASFSAPSIFRMVGVNRSGYGPASVSAALGQMIPDASGSVTGILDHQAISNESFTGSYAIAANGRSELKLTTEMAFTYSHVAYFFSPNEAFLLETAGTDLLFGDLRPQSTEPFSEASLTGTYLTSTGPPSGEATENDCGLTTFDGLGSITSALDVNVFGNVRQLEFDGSYTVAPNGRGTIVFSSPAVGTAVFWVASPTEIVSVGTVTSPYSDDKTLLEFEK